MTKEEKSDAERDELIFDLIKRRLDEEWQRLQNIDNKASSLVGFLAVAVSFLLGSAFLGFFEYDKSDKQIALIFIIGVGMLILSIVFALYGFKVRNWVAVPDVSKLLKDYTTKPYDFVLKKNAATMAQAVMELEVKIDKKAKHLNCAWYSTIVGLILVFVFVIMTVM
ncbi:MAG: hypothetical protein ACT4NT_05005 [Nitrososphaerota archaeon]